MDNLVQLHIEHLYLALQQYYHHDPLEVIYIFMPGVLKVKIAFEFEFYRYFFSMLKN
jgi:hypothetical protein